MWSNPRASLSAHFEGIAAPQWARHLHSAQVFECSFNSRVSSVAWLHNLLEFLLAAPDFTMPLHPEPDPVKGDPLCISGGSHKGRHGWHNEAKTDTAKMACIIVDMGNGVELVTRIKKASIGPVPEAPRSHTEPAVQQIPDIECHLKRATFHLAKCQINDLQDLNQIFGALLLEAQIELESMGPKAQDCAVQFEGDNQNGNDQNGNDQNL